jgi:hypothetical protein
MPCVFPGSTSSQVWVSTCFTSSALSAMPFARAWDTTRPAAPDAWPVAWLPVSPIMLMWWWPPYWVSPESRNHVSTGTPAPTGTGGKNSLPPCPSPSASATIPETKIVWL